MARPFWRCTTFGVPLGAIRYTGGTTPRRPIHLSKRIGRLTMPHLVHHLRGGRWWMTGVALWTLVMGVVSSPTALAAPPSQVSGGPATLYLPTLSRNYTGPVTSSFDRVDAALQQGVINAETALEYKTFALFNDARLPDRYRSSQVGGGADLFLAQVVGAYPTRSASTKSTLTPFLIPPIRQAPGPNNRQGIMRRDHRMTGPTSAR